MSNSDVMPHWTARNVVGGPGTQQGFALPDPGLYAKESSSESWLSEPAIMSAPLSSLHVRHGRPAAPNFQQRGQRSGQSQPSGNRACPHSNRKFKQYASRGLLRMLLIAPRGPTRLWVVVVFGVGESHGHSFFRTQLAIYIV